VYDWPLRRFAELSLVSTVVALVACSYVGTREEIEEFLREKLVRDACVAEKLCGGILLSSLGY